MPVDINNYITNPNSNIFCLKNLPEEVVSFLFARYSRSSLSLKEDLKNMLESEDLDSLVESSDVQKEVSEGFTQTQEKARKFAEKYVLSYGHQSVAEHSILHIALEDISIIASKVIEDFRLTSYTEKSTRYVAFDTNKIVKAKDIDILDGQKDFDDCTALLMNSYLDWRDYFVPKIKQDTPKKENQSENGYNASCMATAFDSLRYLLPAATHTNIGMTINARELAYMIRKLSSHPLSEIKTIAYKLKIEGEKIVPTLLKYTENSVYFDKQYRMNFNLNSEPNIQFRNNVSLLEPYFSEEDAIRLLTQPYNNNNSSVIHGLVSERGRHENFPKNFERISLSFLAYMDYGAYRDIQRHRMATITTDGLNPNYGYEIPRGIMEYGYYSEYTKLMEKAENTYDKLNGLGWNYEAQYVLPLAYRVKTTITMNMRELQHFIELRTGRQGHYSYRHIAQEMYKILEDKYPSFAKYINADMKDYSLTRDEK